SAATPEDRHTSRPARPHPRCVAACITATAPGDLRLQSSAWAGLADRCVEDAYPAGRTEGGTAYLWHAPLSLCLWRWPARVGGRAPANRRTGEARDSPAAAGAAAGVGRRHARLARDALSRP